MVAILSRARCVKQNVSADTRIVTIVLFGNTSDDLK